MQQKLSQKNSNLTSPTAQDLAIFNGINIYAVRADGNCFLQEKIGGGGFAKNLYSQIGENENGTTENSGIQQVSDADSTPNDYNKGIAGENLAKWLNKNASIGEQRNIAFVRSDSEFSVYPVKTTYHHSYDITHDWIKKYNSDASVPNSTTIDVKSEIVAYGAYSTSENCDVYDISLYQEFPADKTFIDDVYVHEYLAYNYKYTGGCYYGPTVNINLDDISESEIELEEIAPLPLTDGQYNNTHYPMQLSFGSSLEGNISTSGVGISSGLSTSCTLPYSTISFNHAEMPINFSNDNKHAIWEYSTDYQIYNCIWGFNPKPNDIPDIVHSFCHTDQAVTFVVRNTKSYGNKLFRIGYDIKYTDYSEYADPWQGWKHTHTRHYSGLFINMPTVNRYFEKYTPYPMPGFSGPADSSEWNNLQALLMNNVNYRALCDETLKVGAQTQDGLDPTAENIWREALESLVKQYNNTKTNYQYVIALAKSDGSHLPLGLQIKDGVWKIVENVDNL